MKSQPHFSFPDEQLKIMREQIQAYFLDELEMEIGDLQSDLFIEFLNVKIGSQYYNLGVDDAIQAIKDKAEDLHLLKKD